ncbi:MAG: DUF2079 domain-containing protein [Elusimicrobiota bacterium]
MTARKTAEKRSARHRVRRALYVWPPAALLCGLAIIFIGGSLRAGWNMDRSVVFYENILRVLLWLNVALCCLMLFGPLRTKASEYLERLGSFGAWRHAGWVVAAYLGIFGILGFVKYVQYRGFQLPLDSSVTGNVAYNFLHHLTLENTVTGAKSYFAIHFTPLFTLIAPLLLLSNTLLPFLFLQTALVASMPVAVYVLAYRTTRSSFAGFIGFWLVLTSRFLLENNSASIQPLNYLAPFFLWAMVFVEARMWVAAAILLLLMLSTNEQAPLTLFGLGLYLALRGGARDKRAWLLGAAVSLGAALLFLWEMKVRFSVPGAAHFRDWSMFSHLGETPRAVLMSAVTDPLGFMGRIMLPIGNLAPTGKLILGAGLFPLLAPAHLAVWAAAYPPHLLAAPNDFYHTLILHYSSFCIGPLWWAGAAGLAWAYHRLSKRQWAPWLLVWAFLIGGANLYHTTPTLMKGWYPGMSQEGPEFASMVPQDAPLWASEYLSPWVSCRSFLKVLPYREDRNFTHNLFMPDYVLFTRHWALNSFRPFRRGVAAMLIEEGYGKVKEGEYMALMKHPRAPLSGSDGRPPVMTLPAPREGLDFKFREAS